MSESRILGLIVHGQTVIDRMKREIAGVIGALAFQAMEKCGGVTSLMLIQWSIRTTEYEWYLYPQTKSIALLTGAAGVRVPLYQQILNGHPSVKLKHVARVHSSLGEFVDAILQRYPELREEIVEPLIRATRLNPQR